jgi:hypothetical protein
MHSSLASMIRSMIRKRKRGREREERERERTWELALVATLQSGLDWI